MFIYIIFISLCKCICFYLHKYFWMSGTQLQVFSYIRQLIISSIPSLGCRMNQNSCVVGNPLVYILSYVEYTRTCFLSYSGQNDLQHQSIGRCSGGHLYTQIWSFYWVKIKLSDVKLTLEKYTYLVLRNTQTSLLCYLNSL